MPKLSEDEVKIILEAEAADALSSEQASKLSADRSKAMDYFLGDMSEDMPSLPDRSKAISSDVSDTIEGLMPSLMEIFCSGDEVVVFDPVGPEDEDAASQETDYINHVFMEKNPGFLVMYSYIKDALLSKNGFVKLWWEDREIEEEETYKGLTDADLGLMLEDDEVEIIEHKTYVAGEDPDPSDESAPDDKTEDAGDAGEAEMAS